MDSEVSPKKKESGSNGTRKITSRVRGNPKIVRPKKTKMKKRADQKRREICMSEHKIWGEGEEGSPFSAGPALP